MSDKDFSGTKVSASQITAYKSLDDLRTAIIVSGFRQSYFIIEELDDCLVARVYEQGKRGPRRAGQLHSSNYETS